MKRLNPDILIGLLLASLFWVGVLVWQSSQPPNHTSAASQHCEGTKSECAKATSDERIADYTWWLAVLTAGLVCSGVIQFGFLIRSDSTARMAAEAAQKSADHIPTVERAWVFCEPINIQQVGLEDYKFEVTVKNHGKTPAFLKSIWAHVRQDEPFDPVPTYAVHAPSQTSIILSAGEARTTDEIFQASSQRIFYGYVRYTDIFNKVQVSRFCLRFAPEGHVAIAGHPNWSIHYTEKENG